MPFIQQTAGLKSVMGNIANFNCTENPNTPTPPPAEIVSEVILGKRTAASGINFTLPVGFVFSAQPTVIVYRTNQTTVPRGIGTSAIKFEYNNYIVDSTGVDQVVGISVNGSNCEIREKIVRLLPTE